MAYDNLKQRTKDFALGVIRLVETLNRDKVADTLGHQLLRSATSVAANYRAACRAKSTLDFISKMGTVEEEADEAGFWMELLVEAGKIRTGNVECLLKEAGELTAIAVASLKTARNKISLQSLSNSAFRTPHSKFVRGVTQAAKGDRL